MPSESLPVEPVPHHAHHLVAASRKSELQAMLLDLRWMQAKLSASLSRQTRADVNALLADYDYLADIADVSLVQRALRMSSHVKLWDLQRGELLHTLSGHGSSVFGVLLLDQDRRALSWSSDHTLNLWDLQRGKLLHTLSGHGSSVGGALLLDQDRRALSWSQDSTLKEWDLKRGELLHTLIGHEGPINGVLR